MSKGTVIFPHQLFQNHPGFKSDTHIFLIEDSLFFGDLQYPLKFHKQKLIFHRASMLYFREYLLSKGYKVTYLEYVAPEEQHQELGGLSSLKNALEREDIAEIFLAEPVDWAIEKRINFISKQIGIALYLLKTPAFLSTTEEFKNFFSEKKQYLQTSFYINQRKKLGILLTDGEPKGGKWTYDSENRKKLPKKIVIPNIPQIKPNKYVKEAVEYVERRFSENPGKIDKFIYPITHEDAWEWFQIFLKERFANFGPYEDALKRGNSFLFHSMLSPLLNTGLITPESVVKEALKYSEKNKIPLNSCEGFIRQIIGWREFMRGIYELEGVHERNSNYWNHKNKIPDAFYTATTEILPIDETITRLLKTSYLHHIERLMILSNFMLLCEIHPKEIYQWFMELFIDAYDWVMVPNVYGMGSYSDGGLISTKPYVSSSNYVLKMSDYPKGEWCEIWDSLYWRFIAKHRKEFKKNPRMSLMVNILNKKNKEKVNSLLDTAKDYLDKLHGNITKG
jgi:deoxyribodipyrimidine photolyase-related protein